MESGDIDKAGGIFWEIRLGGHQKYAALATIQYALVPLARGHYGQAQLDLESIIEGDDPEAAAEAGYYLGMLFEDLGISERAIQRYWATYQKAAGKFSEMSGVRVAVTYRNQDRTKAWQTPVDLTTEEGPWPRQPV
jgi:hypothetical protein